MKILMLCDFYDSKQQYQENLLVKYYLKNGHDVVVVASTFTNIFDFINNKYDRRIPETEEKYGQLTIYYRRYTLNILNKIRKLRGVYGILVSERPDLIFAHDIHFNISDAARYITRNPNTSMIMDYHADYSNSAKNWMSLQILHKIIRKGYFYLYRKYIKRVFPVVPNSMKFLKEVYGLHEDEMELLPLGCDYDMSETLRQRFTVPQLRYEFNIPQDTFVIFTAGKLNREKRTDVLIKSMKLLSDSNILLLIGGSVPNEESMYGEFLNELSVGTNTRFLGWLNTEMMMKYMMVADLAIFPASQSVLWQQAIGMHLPLVIGDSGQQCGMYLNFDNNAICLNVENITPLYISEQIRMLFSDRRLQARMKEGAKNTALNFLNYDVITKRTLQFVNRQDIK